MIAEAGTNDVPRGRHHVRNQNGRRLRSGSRSMGQAQVGRQADHRRGIAVPHSFHQRRVQASARQRSAAPYPGKVIPLNLAQIGGRIIAQKEAFLCAAMGTKLDIAFNKKIGTGLFGGEGFILEDIQGDGLAFVHAGGTIIEKRLAGESLRIDTGCIVAFEPQIDYSIERAGNLKSMMFGGEGIFLATLQGAGHGLAPIVAVQQACRPGGGRMSGLAGPTVRDRCSTASETCSTNDTFAQGDRQRDSWPAFGAKGPHRNKTRRCSVVVWRSPRRLWQGFLETILPHLDERRRRLLVGATAVMLGRGGRTKVAELSGVSRPTVAKGANEIETGAEVFGRQRSPGGGAKPAVETQPGLFEALDALVDPQTRGSPVSSLRWTSKSTYQLAAELVRQGYRVSAGTGATSVYIRWDTASRRRLVKFLCEVVVHVVRVEASGEGDGERVECLFPSLGSGAEFTSSVVPDVADRQIEDLQHGVFGGEMPPGFGDLAELVVQRLYGVGRVNDFAGWRRRRPGTDRSVPSCVATDQRSPDIVRPIRFRSRRGPGRRLRWWPPGRWV